MTTETPTALITGAARGIGAAIAERLSSDGWNVCLTDICTGIDALDYDLASAADLAAAAERCPGETMAMEADVRDAPALAEAVDATIERFGRLDAAIAAAGAIHGGPNGWETPDDAWSAMIDINLTGVFNLSRAAVPAMLASPEPRTGRFVALASAAAHSGLPQLAAYTAAKHGVAGYIRALGAELGPTGITANAVSPGSTATDMLDASAAVYGLDGADAFAEHARISRLIEPREIAEAVAWLCQPESSAITGTVIPVDGGFSG